MERRNLKGRKLSEATLAGSLHLFQRQGVSRWLQ